jgi:hypothetical protein
MSTHVESRAVAHLVLQSDILGAAPRQRLVGWTVRLGRRVRLVRLVLVVWTAAAASILVVGRGPQAFGLRGGGGNCLGFENGSLEHEL